jgi:basic amino acid/polyamine antiporter, APA family
MATGKIRLNTAISMVIANMIGTGVFTSLGFQLFGVQSGFGIVLLWLLGGIIALCGALSYGELASAMPRSGGEYNYLSNIFHPMLGFVAGWVSVIVGFAAPVALSAIALGKYVNKVYPNVNMVMLACVVVIFMTIIHSFTLKRSAVFQDASTIVKLILMVGIILVAFILGTSQHVSILPMNSDIKEQSWKAIFSSSFAVSLNWIYYSYSGWNAAAYVANDMENPKVNIPKALIFSTLVVTVLYLLINYAFLYTAPISELKGQVEVGYISASHIFGTNGGNIMAILIAITLISSVSSLVFIGPRIAQVMGEDLPQISILAKLNKHSIPVLATVVQSAITLALILTSTFESVLLYAGFTLNLFSFLTVFGLMVMRWNRKDLVSTFKVPLYPIPPLIFLALSAWTLYFTLTEHPRESIYGLLTILAGSVIYFIKKPKQTA